MSVADIRYGPIPNAFTMRLAAIGRRGIDRDVNHRSGLCLDVNNDEPTSFVLRLDLPFSSLNVSPYTRQAQTRRGIR